MNPIIFLDIDGVLNDHGRVIDYHCGIQFDKVERLNIITSTIGADLVISTAWRYLILGGAMTVDGFGYLLKTHGVFGNVIGNTCSDEMISGRSNQITAYIKRLNTKYLVIDDLPIIGHPLVQTDGFVGLTDENVEQALKIFKEQ